MWVPQRIAAVPKYIASHSRDTLKDAAPGHKFLGYFRNSQGTGGELFATYKGKARVIGNPTPGPQRREANAQLKAEFDGVLNEVCDFGSASKAQVVAIRARQESLIAHYGTSGYRITTTSTAPFATGLGNEHPIENGFAFLTPYGLPYLAGSGVKGILRRAAEELALDNETQQSGDWTWIDVWYLFGFEGAVDKGSIWDCDSALGKAFARDLELTANHADIHRLIRMMFGGAKEGARFLDVEKHGAEQFLQACLAGKNLRGGLQCRGALDCWDVFPNPVGGKLAVEIMTPHFGKYYRGGDTPHDSGAPVPVSFLAVPAGSAFDFHAVCQATRLPASLQDAWRNLLDRAFQHAFKWVGFGAKTSVGYGAMAVQMPNTIPSTASLGTTTATGAAPTVATAVVTASQSDEQTWPAATLTFNKSTGEVRASFDGKQTAGIKGGDAQIDLKAALGDDRWNKLKSKAELKNVAVTVRKLGNSWVLKGLAEK